MPPNIKFHNPNANSRFYYRVHLFQYRYSSNSESVPFKRGGLRVPVEPTFWPEDRHQRVSINSFGIGGSNAQVIIESAESFGIVPRHRAQAGYHHYKLFDFLTT